jgi:hypothetical protein
MACYKQASSFKKSGQIETNVMDRAREIFEDEGCPFTMEYAWVRLRDESKWSEITQSGSKRTMISASGAYSSSSNPKMSNSECNSALPSITSPRGRNVARKKEKEKYQGTSSVSKDVDNQEKILNNLHTLSKHL